MAIGSGIKYQQLGEGHFYAQERFEQEELTGYLRQMPDARRKSVYEHVIHDSETGPDASSNSRAQCCGEGVRKAAHLVYHPDAVRNVQPRLAILVEEEGRDRLISRRRNEA